MQNIVWNPTVVERNGYILQYSTESPFLRFKGAKRVSTPKDPDPSPTPTPLDPVVAQKEQDKRRQRQRQGGIGGTILTEQVINEEGKATLLGRSALA